MEQNPEEPGEFAMPKDTEFSSTEISREIHLTSAAEQKELENSGQVDTKINEELNKTSTSISGKNVVNNSGSVVNQNINLGQPEGKVFFEKLISINQTEPLAISQSDLRHYEQELIQKRIVILSTPDSRLISRIISHLARKSALKDKEWSTINFGSKNDSSSSLGGEKEGGHSPFANRGIQIFAGSNLAQHHDRVWVIDTDKSNFLKRAIGDNRFNAAEAAIAHLRDKKSFSIWLVSDKDNEKALEDLYEKDRERCEQYFPIWEIDFLPSFLHRHFFGDGDLGKEDAEANYLLKEIQKQDGFWKSNRYEFFDELYQIINNSRNGKSTLREKVKEISFVLKKANAKEKAIEIFEQKNRNTAENLAKNANPVEKVILYLASMLDALTVKDFDMLTHYLLRWVEIDLPDEGRNVGVPPGHNPLLDTVLELELDINTKDLKKLLNHGDSAALPARQTQNTTSGIEYFKKFNSDIFQSCTLAIYTDELGRSVIGFSKPRLKDEIRAYFQDLDPWFSQSQFDKIVELANIALIQPNVISNGLCESIMKLMNRIAQKDIEHYGARLLTPMINRVIELAPYSNSQRAELLLAKKAELELEDYQDLIDDLHLHGENSLINEIVYGRLLFLIEEMLDSDSEDLQNLAKINIINLITAYVNHEDVSQLAIDIIRRTDYMPELDTMEYLKIIFNRSRLIQLRESAINYLVELGRRYSNDLKPFLETIQSWMPEDDSYDQFHHPNAKRVGVIFFFVFADRLMQDRHVVSNYGVWPNSYMLFQQLPDSIEAQKEFLQLFMDLLFHPKLSEAIGNWIFQEHDAKRWDERRRHNQSGSNRVDALHFRYAIIRHIMDEQESLSKKVKNAHASRLLLQEVKTQQLNIFINWIAILVWDKTSDSTHQGSETAAYLLRRLAEKLSKSERKAIREGWKEHTENLLKSSVDFRNSNIEQKRYKIERRFYKFMLKYFLPARN